MAAYTELPDMAVDSEGLESGENQRFDSAGARNDARPTSISGQPRDTRKLLKCDDLDDLHCTAEVRTGNSESREEGRDHRVTPSAVPHGHVESSQVWQRIVWNRSWLARE